MKDTPIRPNQLDPWMQNVPPAEPGRPAKDVHGDATDSGLAREVEAEWKPPEISESKKDKDCDRPHDRVECGEDDTL